MNTRSLLSKAIILTTVLIVSLFAENKMSINNLEDRKISHNLAMFITNAENDGWKILTDGQNNSINITKTFTDSRMLTGVHTRWNRVTETLDVTAVVTESNGKIIVNQTTTIKNPRHQIQYDNAIASLQKSTNSTPKSYK